MSGLSHNTNLSVDVMFSPCLRILQTYV